MVAAPAAAAAPTAAAAPLLSLRGVSKRFGTLQALADVSIRHRTGRDPRLLGENGAGKSTLCNLVFGVYQPDAGEMRFDGAPHRPGRAGARRSRKASRWCTSISAW